MELAVEYVEVSESQGLSGAIPFSEAGELGFVNHRLLEGNSSFLVGKTCWERSLSRAAVTSAVVDNKLLR